MPKWTVGREPSPNCERVREGRVHAAAHGLGPGPRHRTDRGGDHLLPPLSTVPRGCAFFRGPWLLSQGLCGHQQPQQLSQTNR